MAASHRLLICYDGSPGGTEAIEAAARLFPGAPARVAYVWKPPLPYGGAGFGTPVTLPPEIEREVEARARHQAEGIVKQGETAARSSGLDAEGMLCETAEPVWRQLLTVAEEMNPTAIVAGSRGFGEMKALLLGSTSQALAHHSRWPLLIVPGPHED